MQLPGAHRPDCVFSSLLNVVQVTSLRRSEVELLENKVLEARLTPFHARTRLAYFRPP